MNKKIIGATVGTPINPEKVVEEIGYASNSVAGVVKTYPTAGISITPAGQIYVNKASNTHIDQRDISPMGHYQPIVPNNLDYAVMKSLTNPLTHEWTDEEKVKALGMLGVVELQLQFAIKPTTEQAEHLHITDSADYRILDFSLQGKTEQRTTEGNQLFNKALLLEFGGVEQADGSIYIKNNYFSFYKNEAGESGQYTITCTAKRETDSNCLLVNVKYTDNTEEWLLNSNDFPTNAYATATYKTNADKTVSEMLISYGESGYYYLKDLMVNKGATAKPLEEYTGGKASPNPEYPQEIVNAENVEVKILNKNSFDLQSALKSENWKPHNTSGYSYFLIDELKPNTEYTFSFAKNGFTGEEYYVCITNEANKLNWEESSLVHPGASYIKTQRTITSSSDGCLYLNMYSVKDNKLQTLFEKCPEPQVEVGNSRTDYQPYTEQSITLTSPVPITKWDYLTKRDGVWGWSIWSLYLSFDGNYNWRAYESIPQYAGFQTGDLSQLPLSNRRDGYCNMLRVNTQQTTLNNGLWIGAGNDALYLINNGFYDSTLDDKGLANWKAHLNEHPLEIVTYADSEQAFHPLPEAEQTLLNNLETYYGVTNVINDQGCPMQLQYVADTKNYIDNQLLEIKKAMI